jgi:hypothetical protein
MSKVAVRLLFCADRFSGDGKGFVENYEGAFGNAIFKKEKIILTLPIFYYIIKWYDYSQKSFAFIYI